MYALKNCVIYTGKRVEREKAIIVDGSIIRAVIRSDDLPNKIQCVDLGGQSVSPGFIDVQVNGGGGVLFNSQPDIEGVKEIVNAHRKFGTTDLLPTYITGPLSDMKKAIKAVQDYQNEGLSGVLGIHFEGPFIAINRAGVHDKRFIRTALEDDLAVISSYKSGITLITLAPEVVSLEIVSSLSKEGIKISLGHSEAEYSLAYEALNNGASCVTHLYNAMSNISNGRKIGVWGAGINHIDCWAGIIVDGFHVAFEGVELAIRAKNGSGKIFLVTDAMPPVGQYPAKGFKLGEYDIKVEDGRLINEDRILAGSSLDMATAVRNCVQKIGLSTAEALRMASTYVADFLGLSKNLGYIAPGYKANMAIFNNQIQIQGTIVAGNCSFPLEQRWY